MPPNQNTNQNQNQNSSPFYSPWQYGQSQGGYNGGFNGSPSQGGGFNPNPFQLNMNGQNSFGSSNLGSTNTYQDLLNQASQYRNFLSGLYTNNSDIQNARQNLYGIQSQVLGAQDQMNQQMQATRFGRVGTTEGLEPQLNQINYLGSANLANLGVAQNAAANTLGVLQQGRQDTATGTNYNLQNVENLFQASKPTSVAPGASLVNPLTGQEQYNGIGGYLGVQNVQTYKNLQQSYPDAGIPEYNPALTSEQNMQIAQNQVQKSPKYQSTVNTYSSIPLGDGTFAFFNKKSGEVFNSSGQSIGKLPPTDSTGAGGGGGFTESPFNPEGAANFKALQTTLTDLTTKRADTSRAIDTAEQNFPLFLDLTKKAGINDLGAPIANQFAQAFNKKLIGSGDLAAWNGLRTSLQQEYAQILSRGGSVTDKTRGEAENLIAGNISYNALNDLYTTLKKESANVIKGYDNEITRTKGQIKQNATKSSTGATVQTKAGAVNTGW